jgi:hypothetical protein
VADDGEAAQRRRVELLVDDPVADDVLDVVGRHRDETERVVRPIVARVQGGEAGVVDEAEAGATVTVT